MSGRDHETDHDGECFPGCKECKLEELEGLVSRLREALGYAEEYLVMMDDWKFVTRFLHDGDLNG